MLTDRRGAPVSSPPGDCLGGLNIWEVYYMLTGRRAAPPQVLDSLFAAKNGACNSAHAKSVIISFDHDAHVPK